jgi:hypothetical protein
MIAKRRFLSDIQRKEIQAGLGREFAQPVRLREISSLGQLLEAFKSDLYKYFCATQIARSIRRRDAVSEDLSNRLFALRTRLESAIIESLKLSYSEGEQGLLRLALGRPFGYSKKQGASFRMPLTTCMPSRLCGNLCYAHDGLDASRSALLRGCLNFFLSWVWTSDGGRHAVTSGLLPAIRRVVRLARAEAKAAPLLRRGRVRFAHLGEMSAVPEFANYLAAEIARISDQEVDCVVYSRHANVGSLDPNLWIVNFTIDDSSVDRIAWAPITARVVSSAFYGVLQPLAEINFLEHHRSDHASAQTSGPSVCPATIPEARSRTCDGVKCARCFVRPADSGKDVSTLSHPSH